ncbi:Protein nrde2 [Homalodisca vitripennis]|nr:Protein nrde2 [Homalodisca vitripennis]
MGGERVTSERKLAIVERAIQKNPASELLLEERLELCERLWPVDRLAEECVRALAQEPGNFAWWRSLIRTTRNSVARCTAPGVLQVFSKAISRISQLRLHRPDLVIEQDILPIPTGQICFNPFQTLDGQFPSFSSRGPTIKDGPRPSARHEIDVVEYISDRSQRHSHLLHILFSIF